MEKKNPLSQAHPAIYILLAFFLWAGAKDIEILFRGATVTDYILWDHIGLGWAFESAATLLAVLAALLLYCFWRPRPWGVWAGLGYLGLDGAVNALGFLLAARNPELAAEAYQSSREVRYLSQNEDLVGLLMNPQVMEALFWLSLGVLAAMAGILVWQRGYFTGRDATQG
ncbi:MAG: hypothetical protein OEW12_02825 [Deltaproteobacteria bacterium]|nr:hypothetical protein [Deltaproteobacteria bacterium]